VPVKKRPKSEAKSRPRTAPCIAPMSAARQDVTRPEISSTYRSPVPTMARLSTGKPWSER
jgi:hypothetical protein